jgi:hypothetical protein
VVDTDVADESRYALAELFVSAEHLHLRIAMAMEHPYCLRCNRELESGSKFVAVYMFSQTVGVRPRQKSSAKRVCFCPQCAVSLAMGPSPEGALNLAAWEMIRELVSADPALNDAAWQELCGTSQEILPGEAVGARRVVGGFVEF